MPPVVSPCETCGGKGTVPATDKPGPARPCPQCRGSGVVGNRRPLPEGDLAADSRRAAEALTAKVVM